MTKQEEVSLREYIDTRIKALEDRFIAIDRSTDLAAAAVMARLESMNEFRTQLNSQASHFVTRSEIDSKMDAANAVHAEYLEYTGAYACNRRRLYCRGDDHQHRLAFYQMKEEV